LLPLASANGSDSTRNRALALSFRTKVLSFNCIFWFKPIVLDTFLVIVQLPLASANGNEYNSNRALAHTFRPCNCLFVEGTNKLQSSVILVIRSHVFPDNNDNYQKYYYFHKIKVTAKVTA